MSVGVHTLNLEPLDGSLENHSTREENWTRIPPITDYLVVAGRSCVFQMVTTNRCPQQQTKLPASFTINLNHLVFQKSTFQTPFFDTFPTASTEPLRLNSFLIFPFNHFWRDICTSMLWPLLRCRKKQHSVACLWFVCCKSALFLRCGVLRRRH